MKTCKTNLTSLSQWMQCPKVDTEFPGLAYVYPLNELIIVKEKDNLHRIIGKTGICYTIFNKQGQKVFLAVQERKCRKFDVKIFNYYGNEVIQVKRPFNLCQSKALVWAPPGNYVGSVDALKRCSNTFMVKNKHGKVVLDIKADCRLKATLYKIYYGEEEVGTVEDNYWKMVTAISVKNFAITFPTGADIGDKAVLLGACFLIGCLKF